MIAAGTLPPHRVALLAPGPRDEWYSASALYSRALYVDVVPGLPGGRGRRAAGRHGRQPRRAGDAASPSGGAPGTFGALFLQSGSFFMPRFDSQESGFPATAGSCASCGGSCARARTADPVPVQLTCGTAEENVFNNRVMARALAAQGYDARLDEVPDMHNYTGWRDAFDPHLTRPARRVWT